MIKYIEGHGTTIGGIILESGTCLWKDNLRFPQFNIADSAYHGVIYGDGSDVAFILRARVVPLCDMGAALPPFKAFNILQGLETLPLRMERHAENAISEANHLQNHD